MTDTPSRFAVRKNERGTWCVFMDGQMISDHATHAAARMTAARMDALERSSAPGEVR